MEPTATIVIPAYNVAKTIRETLDSALSQTCGDFEVVVVDDGSTDETPSILASYEDPRLRIVRQKNRGLAGARNTGIASARARYIGFLDGDDLWEPNKLAIHIAHLRNHPDVGVSFSASRLIDVDGVDLGLTQTPKTREIGAEDVLLRNPIGNGSSSVIRREALQDVAWRPESESDRDWVFDETFRQSEDIECWMRIALTTRWRFEGSSTPLTLYRVNPGGLSANVDAQLASWDRMLAHVSSLAPAFARRHGPAARAFQLRYLARRAVSARDGGAAMKLMLRALVESRTPVWREPIKTLTTLGAGVALMCCGERLYARLEERAFDALRKTETTSNA